MQNEIGQIIIYPPTQAESLTIGEQYFTEEKTERAVLENVSKRLKRATDEYIEKTRAAQTSDADNIPIQDIVIVVIKELDRISGLNQDSFRYDRDPAEIGGITRFTLYWGNGPQLSESVVMLASDEEDNIQRIKGIVKDNPKITDSQLADRLGLELEYTQSLRRKAGFYVRKPRKKR